MPWGMIVGFFLAVFFSFNMTLMVVRIQDSSDKSIFADVHLQNYPGPTATR